MSFYRHMSTTGIDKPDKFELIGDVVDVLKDTAVEAVASQAPAVNEVAVAGADCWLPVASLQYVIDAVHSFTGLNWWASIAVTTLLIRGATLPLLINELKATTKMTAMKPRLVEMWEWLASKDVNSLSVVEVQNEIKKLFKEYGSTPFTPMIGLFIRCSIFISSYLAITTMAKKMPSFKCGGAYWFTDLTAPDSLYVFPILTALTFLITVGASCNMQDGMEGKPASATKKIVSSVLAILTVPFTMNFPKAIFCYWITSNLFSISYGLVLKGPGVKKALGIPKIPDQPAATARRTSINPYSVLKKTLQQARTAAEEESASVSAAPTKLSNRSTPSSSAINQRIKPLEKQVKGKKNNKKR
ncbi:Mitochondrial inner membrane OXA1 -like protein [Gossypium arboreum]|uniref:Mitochondrial inner membrane OXA1-like protein n=1 Tax=Gossypium arboreum TaxID=29729 RepID=A0A0B0PSR0_GOSAR|nr:Mitochondrial inner membrane OXA1 -like protein [Gossypium arboreum]